MEKDKQLYNWTIDSLVEVELDTPDSFLKIKETLTRIGITNSSENELFQTCHILHKRSRYFIVHFLEMFALDGKHSTITYDDILRRNTIITLLQEWGLLKIINQEKQLETVEVGKIKIIPYKDKSKWKLTPKYEIGNKKKKVEEK